MNTIKGYEIAKQTKKDTIIYVRMDENMISELKHVKKRTDISMSEVIREGVRRILAEVRETGSLNVRLR